MMKKPLNRAIRPIPPYGEFAPVCGTSCSATPKKIAQPMNRKANRNFPFGLVTYFLTQRGAALDRHRRPQDDGDHQDDDGGRDPERDGLLEGDEEQLHGRMLADGGGRNEVRGYDAARHPTADRGEPLS